jgi:hypothetical protein
LHQTPARGFVVAYSARNVKSKKCAATGWLTRPPLATRTGQQSAHDQYDFRVSGAIRNPKSLRRNIGRNAFRSSLHRDISSGRIPPPASSPGTSPTLMATQRLSSPRKNLENNPMQGRQGYRLCSSRRWLRVAVKRDCVPADVPPDVEIGGAALLALSR